jgi:hypothetical protein
VYFNENGCCYGHSGASSFFPSWAFRWPNMLSSSGIKREKKGGSYSRSIDNARNNIDVYCNTLPSQTFRLALCFTLTGVLNVTMAMYE